MQIIIEELRKYTTFRVGGYSKIYLTDNYQELTQILQDNDKEILLLGLGSNLLVKDKGFDGIVIHTKLLNKITVANNIISAQSGVSLAKLSKFAGQHKQNGANFISVIPGTVGGALQMNAGCFNKEIWQFVIAVKTMDKNGNIHNRNKNDFVINYRKIIPKFKDEFFLSAQFIFDNNSIIDIKHKKYARQPIGSANCGSVFKNPVDNFAAKLIEDCKLKSFCIGGACVSSKHANFIINTGTASSQNIIDLISHIQKIVLKKYKILLETEVVIIK